MHNNMTCHDYQMFAMLYIKLTINMRLILIVSVSLKRN